MATLEELDFKLVLDDSNFDKKIETLTKKAKELNVTLSGLLTISGSKELDAFAGKIVDSVREAKNEIDQANKEKEKSQALIEKEIEALVVLKDLVEKQLKTEEKITEEKKKQAKNNNADDLIIDFSGQEKELNKLTQRLNVINNVINSFDNEAKASATERYKQEVDYLTNRISILTKQINDLKDAQSKLSAEAANLVAQQGENVDLTELKDKAKQITQAGQEMLKAQLEADKEQKRQQKESDRAQKEVLKEKKRQQKEYEKAQKDAIKAQKEAEKLAAKNAAETERKRKALVATLKQEYSIYKSFRKELTFQTEAFQTLKSAALAYFSIDAVKNFISQMVSVTAEFEKQKIALSAIIHDSMMAEGIIAKLQTLAVKSPFQLGDLTEFTKQLSAYNIPVNELYETTKMLADVSAGLGVDMSRIILAYGQVSTSEVLRGQEVRQFTEAGLPILTELANQFTAVYNRAVSVNEVFDLISKRKVPFEMVKQIFVDLTSEGGKFFNMQEVLADTLSGKIENLTDAYHVMLYEIGEGQSETINGVVDTLRKLIINYEDVIRVIKVLVSAYGAYKALQLVEIIIKEAQALEALKKAMNAAELAQLQLNSATKRSVWGLIAAGVVAAAVGIYEYVQAINELSATEKILNDASSKYINTLSLEQTKVRLLIDDLSKLEKGTEEYEKKKKSLIANYGEYLDDVDLEKIKVGDLIGLYEKLAEKIDIATQAKINSYAKDKAEKEFDLEMSKINESFDEYAKINNWNAGLKYELRQFYLGLIEVQNLSAEAQKVVQQKALTGWEGFFSAWSPSQDTPMNLLRERVFALKDKLAEVTKLIDEEWKPGTNEENPLNNIIPDFSDDKATKGFSNAIKEIEKLIALYRKIIAMREDLTEIGVENPNDTLKSFFPWLSGLIDDDANQKIEELLAKLRELGQEGIESADNIKFDMQNKSFSRFVDNTKKTQNELKRLQEEFAKAKEKYDELVDSMKTSAELQGTGVIFDTSKDIKTYIDNLEKLEKKKKETVEALNATDLSDDEKTIEKDKIKDLAEKQSDNYLTELKDKLYEDGENFFKEYLETLGLPDGEWSKINPFKKLKIGKRLQDAMNSEQYQTVRTSISEMLRKAGLNEEEISSSLEVLDKGFGKGKESAQSKLGNFGKDILKYVTPAVKELTSNLSKYADVSGDSRMKEGSEVLQGLATVGESLIDGFAQGNFAGAIAAAAKVIIETVVQEISYAKQLENQIKKTKHEVDLLEWDNMLDTENIFGDDYILKMSKANEVLGQINAKYKELENTLRNQDLRTDFLQGFESLTSNLIFTAINIPAAISDSRKQINAFNDAVSKGYKDLETYIVKFNDRGGLANFFGISDEYTNLRDLFASVGFDSVEWGAFRSMYDEYGNLNAEGLQKILDTYDRLSNADKEWMENAIDYCEKYKEVMEEVDDVLEDVYGSAVTDLADKMIDNWIQLGNAAGDYSDILSDVAKSYAKLMIQNTLMESIFNDEMQEKLRQAFLDGDSVSALRLFSDAFAQLEEYIPTINEILQGINNEIPLLDESSQDLSDGIKSITEETASLLASYVNAIRADVSLSRIGVQSMTNDVKAILGLLPSTPTLSDYLNQIQANTYNTQLATENIVEETHSILTEIRGVIGTETGVNAIRVSM